MLTDPTSAAQAERLSDLEWDSSRQEETVHLRDYVQIILQRWPLALITFLAIVLLAFLYTWTRTPRYTSTARILVEPVRVDLTGIQDSYDSGSLGGKREFMSTQATLITSRPILENAIASGNLIETTELEQSSDPLRDLAKAIEVNQVRGTYLIDISFASKNASQAARTVNAVVDAFVADHRKRRLGISDDGLDELREKADALRVKLDAATTEIQAFMKEHRMVSFEKTENVIMDRLRELSSKLTATEPRRMALQSRVNTADQAIQNGERLDSLPDVMSSPIIKQFKLQLSSLEGDYSQLLQRLGANHPQLQAAETHVQAIQSKLAIETASILASIRLEYEQVCEEERLLHEAIREHEQKVFDFNELSSFYNVLEQKRESIAKTYSIVMRRIEEIDINRIGGQGQTIFVISRAAVPTQRSWPSRSKNMAVAIVLGVGFAVALCFFLDYMDTTIKGEMDVRSLMGCAVIGAVPDVRRDQEGETGGEIILTECPHGHAAEAFRSLRTSLAFALPGHSLRSIVISSTFPAEGKTLVATNLAVAHAQIGRRTLLVDADLRKPRLHRVFDVDTGRGFSTLLAGPREPVTDEVFHKTDVDNLFFLPCGPIPPNPVELLDSDRFIEVLKELQERFDLIVFDSPPGYSLVDSVVMARSTNGLLLVVRSMVTPKMAAAQMATRVRATGAYLLGAVLNNVDVPRHAQYGYYRYGSYQYGKYYYEAETEETPTGA